MNLAKAALGWRQVAGLGVALVIAGQFSGWNYALASAGWGNMVVATIVMAAFCFGLASCVAELSASRPHAGGLYIYCEDAFGAFAGYIVGFAIFTALAIGTGAAAEFISAYSLHVLGIGGWPLKLGIFAVILALHLRGVGEAMGWLLAAGVIALTCIVLVAAALLPHFSPDKLVAEGERLRIDAAGVITCIPFAIWLFCGVEQAAAASEEAADPGRTMPRGILAAITILLISALSILVLAVGGGGLEHVANADDPLYSAITSPQAPGVPYWLTACVGIGGIFGLLATLFSLIYSSSRQLFALSRDGHLPAFLARTNRRGSPYVALILVGLIGLTTTNMSPEKIMLCVVLGLSGSYIVLLAAFIRLRFAQPELDRPFRVPSGVVTAGLCLCLAIVVFAACFQVDLVVLIVLGFVFALACLSYFLTTNRVPAGQVL